MQYERTTLVLSGNSDVTLSVQALRVGVWYVHRPLSHDGGLMISHRCGVAVAFVERPGQAVAVIRALQTVPECPVSDETLVRRASTPAKRTRLRAVSPLAAWLTQVKAAIDDIVRLPPPFTYRTHP